MKKAFTLIEIIIVMAIVLILTAAAITGTSRILKNIQFNNVFNKLVFMVQTARNLAIAGKTGDTNVRFYDLHVETSLNQFLDLRTRNADGSTDSIEFYFIDKNKFKVFSSDITNGIPGIDCPQEVHIKFEVGTGKFFVNCPGGLNPEAKIIQVGVKELQENAPGTREQSFLIHRATGIPQVQRLITH